MIDEISNDLPNFPEEVVEQWLLPFAVDEGWPPESERWKYLLNNTDLNYWREINWQLEEVNFSDISLSNSAKLQIQGLLDAYLNGVENEYWHSLGERGKDRFQFQLHQLIDYGVFLLPPVLVDHGDSYDIMDGNHRIAAYVAWQTLQLNEKFVTMLGKNPVKLNETQRIWIGGEST
jgi:hypothetical protein